MGFADILRENHKDKFCYGHQPVYFNTGTLFDLEAGRLSIGENDSYLIGGGFGNYITAVQGPANVFKTTGLMSNIVKVLDIYPDSNCIPLDTEGSLVADLPRLARFSNRDPVEALKYIHPMLAGSMNVGSVYVTLKSIIDERERMDPQELWVETPFVNLETKQKIKVRKPLLVPIDSWSQLQSAEAQDIISKEGLAGSKTNTVSMSSGNRKSLLFSELRAWSEKYGVSFILSAQLGDKFSIDPMAPRSKQLSEMRMNEETKGTSPKYNYLVHVAYQIMGAHAYFGDKSKKDDCKYPYDEYTMPKDLYEIVIKFVRTKINMTGNEVSKLIFSQREGFKSALTNLDYLKDHDYYGLAPANQSISHSLNFMPDKKFNRKTIRKMTETEYEVERALELCVQLHYVQTYWRHIIGVRYPNQITPMDLYNKLIAPGSSAKLSDILNSRSYWTYDPNNKRPWMNVFKVMDLMGMSDKVSSSTPAVKKK